MNHFKMAMADNNKIFVYKIDFGPNVDSTSLRETRKVARSIREEISKVYGVFNSTLNFMITKRYIE